MLRKLCLACLLAGLVATSAYSGVVQPTQTSLYDLFPKQNQGENGIYLQYLSPDGSYTNLVCLGDYVFGTIGTMWNLPNALRSPHYPESIHAHPTAVTQCGYDRDSVIRVTLNGNYGIVRVTGLAQTASWGYVRYYIYKGAQNYNRPIWEQWNTGSFDLLVPYNAGDELFFVTDAGGADFNDWANWRSVKFQAVSQAVPEIPATTLAFIGTGLGCLVRRRRL
jgi:hypothetical protein